MSLSSQSSLFYRSLVRTNNRALFFPWSCSTRIERLYSACWFLHLAKTTSQYAVMMQIRNSSWRSCEPARLSSWRTLSSHLSIIIFIHEKVQGVLLRTYVRTKSVILWEDITKQLKSHILHIYSRASSAPDPHLPLKWSSVIACVPTAGVSTVSSPI